MSTVLDALGISSEMVNEVSKEEVYEGKTLPAGLYDAEVGAAFIRKTDKGANMFELDLIIKDEKGEPKTVHYSTAVKSGDEKGNKTTYTDKRTGKELPLPGVVSMTKFLQAVNSIKAKAEEGQIKFKDQNINALIFAGVQGKKLKVGLIQEEGEYNGSTYVKNDVKYWLNENGENSEGENLEEKVKEKIEQNPIKRLKGSANTQAATPASTGDAAVAAASGW